jgi:hypothetical protein
LGASLHHLGQEADAANAFDRARKIGLPWRMLWYQFDMFETYLSTGRYQDVLDLAGATVDFRRIDYDVTETQRRMRALKLPGMLVDRLSFGL